MIKTAKDYTNLIPPWKTIGISNNLMFRLVMDNTEICQGFIERLLNIKVAKIKTQVMELDIKNNLLSKGIRLDAYVEDADGVAYDIEMQSYDYGPEALGKRIRYYQSTMDMNLLKKNVPYRQLRKSYIIFICTFDPFGLNLPRYTFTNTCHENNRLELYDDSVKIIFNTTANTSLLNPEQAALLNYINGAPPQDNFVKQIDRQVTSLHNEPAKEMTYMTYSQVLMEQKEQGITQGITQVALNMLSTNFSLEQIKVATQLSVDDIRTIAKDHGLSCP